MNNAGQNIEIPFFGIGNPVADLVVVIMSDVEHFDKFLTKKFKAKNMVMRYF